jgi:ketosteroid isomerase-like protein
MYGDLPTRFAERLVRSLEQLNRGDFDEMLSRYAEDIVVLIPTAKPGDAVHETMFYGRAGFRDCLRRYVATLSPLRSRGVRTEGTSRAIAKIECRGARVMTYAVEFDRAGFGRRVTISLS